MKTTLNKIRDHGPCSDGWEKLLKHLGKTKADDVPLSLITVLDSNGLDDALWCLRAVDGFDREIRLFAVACARDVQHLMRDERSIKALDVAERYANGVATEGELKDAADAAAWAAADAAAWAAADAARSAWDAARSVASAARSVASAAYAAWYAAWDAARDAEKSAAMDAIRSKQKQRFREMVIKNQEGVMEMKNPSLIEILNEPEKFYPDNFSTPKRANALLASLCQQAADALENNQKAYERGFVDGMQRQAQSSVDKAVNRLAQKPEPVAWMYEWDGRNHLTFTDQSFVEKAHPHFNKSTPLYTAPPQRKPLTLPQIHELNWPDDVAFEDILEFTRAIEAAHGIKE